MAHDPARWMAYVVLVLRFGAGCATKATVGPPVVRPHDVSPKRAPPSERRPSSLARAPSAKTSFAATSQPSAPRSSPPAPAVGGVTPGPSTSKVPPAAVAPFDPAMSPPPADHSLAFFLPLVCGTSARVTQGNFGRISHRGGAKYAFDYALGVGTPLVAMADGVVVYTYDRTRPGHKCYRGGDKGCYRFANYVVLRHQDGSESIYKHLSRVSVKVGDAVARGRPIGASGSTGYSTGPHAHVMRRKACGHPIRCPSIPLVFRDVPGGGVPQKGDTVTSRNCP